VGRDRGNAVIAKQQQTHQRSATWFEQHGRVFDKQRVHTAEAAQCSITAAAATGKHATQHAQQETAKACSCLGRAAGANLALFEVSNGFCSVRLELIAEEQQSQQIQACFQLIP